MKKLFFVLAGFLSGVVGGMGMGGGTVLIPVLTMFLGVEQKTAQGINLLVFIPTALLAVSIYLKKGLINKRYILLVGIPALVSSVCFSFVVSSLPQDLIKTFFGWFLCLFGSIFLFFSLKKD